MRLLDRIFKRARPEPLPLPPPVSPVSPRAPSTSTTAVSSTATAPTPPARSLVEGLAAKWIPPPVPKATALVTTSTAGASTVSPWSTRVRSTYPTDPAVAAATKGPSDAEIARAKLRPCAAQEKLAGITEKLIVEDEQTGRRYLFKVPEPGKQALERELVALRLRRTVGQPSIACAAQQVTLADGRVVHGYVKPLLDDVKTLSNDPRDWTEQQKTAVLVDHLWAELTGNYDTKPLQYVVVGDSALNIDWDHSMCDTEKNVDGHFKSLSRHKAGAVAPAAQRLLLSSWVRGEIELDFRPLYEALEHIEKLTRRDMLYAVAPLMESTGGRLGELSTVERVVGHMMERKDSLRWRFDEMLRRARNERQDHALVHQLVRPSWATRMLMSFGEARLTVLTMAMNTKLFDTAYDISQQWQKLKRTVTG